VPLVTLAIVTAPLTVPGLLEVHRIEPLGQPTIDLVNDWRMGSHSTGRCYGRLKFAGPPGASTVNLRLAPSEAFSNG
jgi:hypothetical protein